MRTRKNLEETARKPGKVVREVGNVDAAFAQGRKSRGGGILRAAAGACVDGAARGAGVYKDGKVEVWAPTQSPAGARDAIAAAVGAKKEDVTVNVTLLGGAFGRKSFPDFAVEAAVLSKKTGKPVKVVWSREDDIKFDSYHSVSAMYMKATLGADGKPTAWLQRTVFPPIGSTFDATARCIRRRMNLGWASAICRMRFRIIARRTGRRQRTCASDGSGRWRTFITRSRFSRFTDELAHAAGKDPVEYTLALLGPDRIIPKSELPKDYTNYGGDYAQYPIDTARFKRVVQLAAEKSGWGKKKIGQWIRAWALRCTAAF